MTVQRINRKYAKRIKNILENIKQTLQNEGWKVEGPIDMACDEYCYSLFITRDAFPDEPTDISIKICESEEADGSEDGINFSLNIVAYGGEILGGLTPFNYTNDCWISRHDAIAIEERFRIIEQADFDEINCLLAQPA